MISQFVNAHPNSQMLTLNLADKEPATFWPSQCPIPGRAKKKVKARSVDVLC